MEILVFLHIGGIPHGFVGRMECGVLLEGGKEGGVIAWTRLEADDVLGIHITCDEALGVLDNTCAKVFVKKLIGVDQSVD